MTGGEAICEVCGRDGARPAARAVLVPYTDEVEIWDYELCDECAEGGDLRTVLDHRPGQALSNALEAIQGAIDAGALQEATPLDLARFAALQYSGASSLGVYALATSSGMSADDYLAL